MYGRDPNYEDKVTDRWLQQFSDFRIPNGNKIKHHMGVLRHLSDRAAYPLIS
jgi:hypothetical protein